MKTLITAAVLLALTTPAFAFGNHSDLDCGNGVGVVLWKNTISMTVGDGKSNDYPTPSKGVFKWNKKGFFLNGRKCLLLSDGQYLTKQCAEGDDDSCKAYAEGWERTPEQVKRDVYKWKTNWPGNTIRKH